MELSQNNIKSCINLLQVMSNTSIQSPECEDFQKNGSENNSDSTWGGCSSKLHSFSTSTSLGSANDLLTYVSPFNPYLDQNSFDDLDEAQRYSVTDRFIPSRKLLKRDTFFQENSTNNQQQNDHLQAENSSMNVSDIYRRLMVSGNYRQGERLIDTFENTNFLKYTQKSSNPQYPSISRVTGLDFTEDLGSNASKKRKINKIPCKVLDAPALQDDYYLNLIDWGSQNLLAVGLSSSVYLWNANNSKVSKLCDLGISDSATSVSWAAKGPHLALGTNSGQVQIWDTNKMKRLRIMHGHTNRVGAAAWNSTILTTGSRDKTILHRDPRSNANSISKLTAHRQEVCGLKWSPDDQQLCSGGNDNRLLVWNGHSTEPILKFSDHQAAVKAVAWSPHQHGLLVSGGGTADRTIRFRNTLTGTTVQTVEVGSQVCNLMFSKTLNELVSTHGYSHNEINVWKCPKMQKVATLTGHTYRVLYLAMSPDGSTIVTGAGDETLRFWNVFPTRSDNHKKSQSLLQIEFPLIR